MKRRINVRNMQRTPHVHIFGDRINGRDVCDSCPYRAQRHHIISAFGNDTVTIRLEDENFEKKLVLLATIPNLTVPELKEMILKHNPNATGLSKMRKLELMTTLVDCLNAEAINWTDEFAPFLEKQLQDPKVRAAYEAEKKVK